MPPSLVILLAIAALAALYLILAPVVRLYLKYRGDRVVTCPETSRPAGVKLDAVDAALSGFTGQNLHLKECSRWPERADCGQACLREIESAPEGCLVRNILAKWYAGKKCAVCGKAFGAIQWAEHKPALMSPGRKSMQWSDIRPEEIPSALSSHWPVCWSCHIAWTLRRDHPNLVVDRPWKTRE